MAARLRPLLGDRGIHNSLALDSLDLPHISYADIGSQNLKFAGVYFLRVSDGTATESRRAVVTR